MEAVRTHADTVGLLKAVRDQPKAFRSVLKKAKEAYTQCGRAKSELCLQKKSLAHPCGRALERFSVRSTAYN